MPILLWVLGLPLSVVLFLWAFHEYLQSARLMLMPGRIGARAHIIRKHRYGVDCDAERDVEGDSCRWRRY
jgi:hypothetical protein